MVSGGSAYRMCHAPAQEPSARARPRHCSRAHNKPAPLHVRPTFQDARVDVVVLAKPEALLAFDAEIGSEQREDTFVQVVGLRRGRRVADLDDQQHVRRSRGSRNRCREPLRPRRARCACGPSSGPRHRCHDRARRRRSPGRSARLSHRFRRRPRGFRDRDRVATTAAAVEGSREIGQYDDRVSRRRLRVQRVLELPLPVLDRSRGDHRARVAHEYRQRNSAGVRERQVADSSKVPLERRRVERGARSKRRDQLDAIGPGAAPSAVVSSIVVSAAIVTAPPSRALSITSTAKPYGTSSAASKKMM